MNDTRQRRCRRQRRSVLRPVRVLAAIALAIAGTATGAVSAVGGGPSPAHADAAPAERAPRPEGVAVQGTVVLNGVIGDYVTQGASYRFTTPSTPMRLKVGGPAVGAQHWLSFGDFDTVNGIFLFSDSPQLPRPGTYTVSGPVRTGPTMRLVAFHRSCNFDNGTWTIKRLVRDRYGDMVALSVDFTQTCLPGGKTISGSIDVKAVGVG